VLSPAFVAALFNTRSSTGGPIRHLNGAGKTKGLAMRGLFLFVCVVNATGHG
jgi:hypothetical protein